MVDFPRSSDSGDAPNDAPPSLREAAAPLLKYFSRRVGDVPGTLRDFAREVEAALDDSLDRRIKADEELQTGPKEWWSGDAPKTEPETPDAAEQQRRAQERLAQIRADIKNGTNTATSFTNRQSEPTSEQPTVSTQPGPRGDALRMFGLSDKATANDIKKAYRQMVKQLHPDKHPDATPGDHASNQDRFRKATEAYDFLMD